MGFFRKNKKENKTNEKKLIECKPYTEVYNDEREWANGLTQERKVLEKIEDNRQKNLKALQDINFIR